jgi:thymidylate synthase
MNKADKYYLDNINKIMNEGSWDENPRPKYHDGTPAYSKFITQVFEEYDITKGEFPIITLRNTAIKTGIKEMMVIYQKQLNSRIGFEENGVNWWEEWMNESGDIGRAYSYNIESHRPKDVKRTVVKIKHRKVDVSLKEFKEIKFDLDKSIDGVIYSSNYRNYGNYIIINSFVNDGRRYVECQFLNTGYKCVIREDSLKRGQHPKNNYIRTNNNVGYLDNVSDLNFKKEEIKKLQNIWSRMIRRCYDKYYKEYYSNIFVHQDWHSFRNFLKDVRYLPQYHLAKENNFKDWELDKDYYGSNAYSKDTCVFLTKKENLLYRSSQIDTIKIIDTETNKTYYELSYSSLSESLGLSRGYVRNIVKKGYYKKLKFEQIKDDQYLYRYELSRNQINSLLENLKKDKYSRRQITSFWNWSNIDKKELVECAYETLWSVRKIDGEYYLDMTLIQRSSDYLTANTINKVQYLALQMMVAGHCGYKVGKFCHLVQNLHIYDRHFNAVDEILEKTPLDDKPYIELVGNKDFYDYTINDFKIYNIENIKKINSKLELAI